MSYLFLNSYVSWSPVHRTAQSTLHVMLLSYYIGMCVFQCDICRRRAYSQGFAKAVHMSYDRQHLDPARTDIQIQTEKHTDRNALHPHYSPGVRVINLSKSSEVHDCLFWTRKDTYISNNRHKCNVISDDCMPSFYKLVKQLSRNVTTCITTVILTLTVRSWRSHIPIDVLP